MAHLMLREQVTESVTAERLRCAITGDPPPNLYAELVQFDAFLEATPRRATPAERAEHARMQALGLRPRG